MAIGFFLPSTCSEAEHQSRRCGGIKLLMVARKSKEDRKGLISTSFSGAQTSDLSSPQDLVFYWSNLDFGDYSRLKVGHYNLDMGGNLQCLGGGGRRIKGSRSSGATAQIWDQLHCTRTCLKNKQKAQGSIVSVIIIINNKILLLMTNWQKKLQQWVEALGTKVKTVIKIRKILLNWNLYNDVSIVRES